MQLLQQYLVIALGGALGSMLRFGVGTWIDSTVRKTLFPWGTVFVNISGCFVIGFIAMASLPPGKLMISQLMRQFIMIGILGGYTTFSSFTLQTLMLANDKQWGSALANVVISVVLCLVGVWLGAMLAGWYNRMR